MKGKSLKRYFSAKELAERWGVGKSTIYDWVKVGILPPPRKLGCKLARFPIETVEMFEKQKEGGV